MSYKRLGNYIQQVNVRNRDSETEVLLGVSITKKLIPSIANIIGTDMSVYKIIKKRQFAYGTVTSRNGEKISIALSDQYDKALVSQIYVVFEVIDTDELLPEYLMMWFSRPEFDRYVRFHSHGSTRETFDWADMCEVELPIPSIEEQRQIVAQYQSITNKIKVNEQICEKLEATAQALYKHWFVDFEFPIPSTSNPELVEGYKSSGGKMVWNEELGKKIPEGWEVKTLGEICEKISSGSTPSGGKENYRKEGISLIRSMNVYDLNFIYDDLAFIDETQAKKLSNVIIKEDDVLFNITGVSVARCTMVPSDILPARVNQHVMIIRSKENFKLNHYILLNLVSNESKNQLLGVSQSGSTREAITKSDIEGFSILLPDLNLIDSFNSTVKITTKLINKIRKQNQKLAQLQSLLLSRLAVGEEVSA
ncbi:restriction endonuclease subunit S [Chryseobacterium echinoideorum]|uniref:restriction endonuclease subunit S n=1 Tax=Chryseobacterium echinoideorum TaxID=1549648 RepID=UPI001185C65D|nr:restriction endonuclease subunit S [Chryseobacterium echinoideorum]